MIRIDEIYNNTFWCWLQQHRPGFRLYMCEPFGRSDPDSVINYGRDDIHEHNYIFFFDQEPIHLKMHAPTFSIVKEYAKDIDPVTLDTSAADRKNHVQRGYLCTSEKDSDNVDYFCTMFNWKPLYYFFHGWAALDWYRGYDKTFLITPWNQRKITKTFLAPNRIVAGARNHRLELLYHIFKHNMTDNHISCPMVCPAENINVHTAIKSLELQYPDIADIFDQQSLPINFAGETDHPMHSCWLSLFDQAAESLLYLVTETVATGRRLHLTEKTFKPIAMGMPFVIAGTKGSLAYLRSYGFRTFDHLWDESYDLANDGERIQQIAALLRRLHSLSVAEKQNLFEQAQEVIEHNWNHFYNGGFETVLWQELQEMVNGIAI